MAWTIGVRKVPWHSLTSLMLLVQLVLTMFASFLKADFVSLTCVTIGILYIHDASNLERKTFRHLVVVVFLSLVYDIVWFAIYDEAKENALDGGTQPNLRKITLIITYFSFLFRVSTLSC